MQNIQKISKDKYQFSDVKISLLTCSEKDRGMYSGTQRYEIQQLDFAASEHTVPMKESWMRYEMWKLFARKSHTYLPLSNRF